MKVEDRDLNKVKIDPYLNNDVWFRGRTQPPARVKVKATKEGGIVSVTFANMPEIVGFEKAKIERRHKPSEAKKPKSSAKDDSKEETSAQEVKEEKEKEVSAAIQKEAQAKMESKEFKHALKEPKSAQVRQRKQLSK